MSQEGLGVAKSNEALEIMTIDSVLGPIAIGVKNEGDGTSDVVCMFAKTTDLATPLLTDQDTAVADEDTGYDGDTSETDFTGESLDNTPVIPKSVLVKPTTGGDSVNAYDRDGDGILYTSDDDEDVCGFINYHTGALRLNFPTGKEPNTGDIDCDYKYSVEVKPQGKVIFKITNVKLGERIKMYAAAEYGDDAEQVYATVMDIKE